MSNEPKKTTLARTQLGWSGNDKTEVTQQPWGAQPYAHLLESRPPSQPNARGSGAEHPQVQVHQDYVQQAQGEVKQYNEDPYTALAAQYGVNARTNANVQRRAPSDRDSRRAIGSTPPPQIQKPLFNDPTKPHAYNMAAAAESLLMPQQEQATVPYQQGYAYQQNTQYTPGPTPEQLQEYYAQQQHAYQQQYATSYQAYAQQADHAVQQAQQAQQQYAQQEYQAQQAQYAQQQAQYAQQQAEQAYAQQYAQQQADYAAQYAQQAHAQQYGAETQQAQQFYAQQPQQTAAAADLQQYYAAQYAQQVAAYNQQQPQPQQPAPEGNYLGNMAAKLQKKAEKQKAKLEAALEKKGKSGDKREAAIPGAIALTDGSARRDFVKRTYKTLFFAILAFAGLLWSFMNIGPLRELLDPFVRFALGGRWNWGVVLAAFMGASIVAERWAANAKSRKMQYAGLGFYVLAEAVIFVPLLAVVEWKTAGIIAKGGGEPNIVRDAAFLTLAVFGMLTASVVFSKKDFSFLRSGLWMASGLAMTLIVLSLVFGFNLGLIFSIAMVVLAAGYMLYHTSQVLAHYDPEHHVSAALELFSSMALMFWYMIRIFLRARD
jgi:FtsH-binding integral membrane protein